MVVAQGGTIAGTMLVLVLVLMQAQLSLHKQVMQSQPSQVAAATVHDQRLCTRPLDSIIDVSQD